MLFSIHIQKVFLYDWCECVRSQNLTGWNHNTPKPLYNTVRYNTVLDITRFKDGSQKCIDYIEE